MKLIQKHPLKGTRIFELVDDAVNVQIKSPFKKQETLTVMLTVLNQEPVISKSLLEFTSRVNNEPLLSLYLAKPNAEEFNSFVNLLKQKIQDEFNVFAGLKAASSSALQGNVFEEPPEFDSDDNADVSVHAMKSVDADQLKYSIEIIQTQVGGDSIGNFIAALQDLQADPQNIDHLKKVVSEFHSLGPAQGAILTYAPYITSLLSDDPFSF